MTDLTLQDDNPDMVGLIIVFIVYVLLGILVWILFFKNEVVVEVMETIIIISIVWIGISFF